MSPNIEATPKFVISISKRSSDIDNLRVTRNACCNHARAVSVKYPIIPKAGFVLISWVVYPHKGFKITDGL